jgi:hypothetical protein
MASRLRGGGAVPPEDLEALESGCARSSGQQLFDRRVYESKTWPAREQPQSRASSNSSDDPSQAIPDVMESGRRAKLTAYDNLRSPAGNGSGALCRGPHPDHQRTSGVQADQLRRAYWRGDQKTPACNASAAA